MIELSTYQVKQPETRTGSIFDGSDEQIELLLKEYNGYNNLESTLYQGTLFLRYSDICDDYTTILQNGDLLCVDSEYDLVSKKTNKNIYHIIKKEDLSNRFVKVS